MLSASSLSVSEILLISAVTSQLWEKLLVVPYSWVHGTVRNDGLLQDGITLVRLWRISPNILPECSDQSIWVLASTTSKDQQQMANTPIKEFKSSQIKASYTLLTHHCLCSSVSCKVVRQVALGDKFPSDWLHTWADSFWYSKNNPEFLVTIFFNSSNKPLFNSLLGKRRAHMSLKYLCYHQDKYNCKE